MWISPRIAGAKYANPWECLNNKIKRRNIVVVMLQHLGIANVSVILLNKKADDCFGEAMFR